LPGLSPLAGDCNSVTTPIVARPTVKGLRFASNPDVPMLPLSSVCARSPVLLVLAAVWVNAPACASTGPSAPPAHASPVLQHSQRTAPTDARYASLAAQANDDLRRGHFAAALEAADHALALVPFALEAGLAKVEAHLQLGQRTAALDYASRLVDARPGEAATLYAEGRALLSMSRAQDAAPVFQAALVAATAARAPLDETFALLGLLTALAYDVDVPLAELVSRADELAQRVTSDLDPRPDALHALGIACELRKLGDDRAAAFYRDALALRPDAHPYAHLNLAKLLDASTGRAAARTHFEAFIAQAPPSARAEVERIQKLLQEDTP
jgi:hypothetical protein